MKYFPSPDVVLGRLAAAGVDDAAGNTFALRFIRSTVSYAIRRVGIDEERYFSDYPDLKAAFEGAAIGSGAQHYANQGFFEKRRALPKNFDAGWYVERYPDVRTFLDNEPDYSPEDHFLERGFLEWRLPCAEAESDLRFWLNALT